MMKNEANTEPEPLKLLDIANFDRFKDEKFVKVLRHKDKKRDLWELVQNDMFEKYQNIQSWDVFGKSKYIISFIAERYSYAKFVGVWEILNKRQRVPSGFIYKTQKLSDFDDLSGRLIIKWGPGTKSWAQNLHKKGNKEIIEILPPNYVMDFPGFYDFKLSYAEICKMINNPDSNREWFRMLSSVSGVYIILDTVTGKQYIGSGYGKGGIWNRWKSYVKNPSGGNTRLKELLQNFPGRHKHFQFSILRVLEYKSNKEDVIAQESFIKDKLGSKAFGLNGN